MGVPQYPGLPGRWALQPAADDWTRLVNMVTWVEDCNTLYVSAGSVLAEKLHAYGARHGLAQSSRLWRSMACHGVHNHDDTSSV